MLCKVFCAACKGLEAFVVTVEVDVSDGISFFLVGLPDSAVKESQQRIGSALGRYGYRIPGKRIVINLAPANMRKEGSAFDVPIAMGILLASGQAESAAPQEFIILGELALDGSLRPVTGALPVAIHAAAQGYKYCVFPADSAMEASEIEGVDVFGAETLQEVIGIMRDPDKYRYRVVNRGEVHRAEVIGEVGGYDFADVKGQLLARKGLEIAAAGGHNVLMTGSPGSGKTLMAKCLPSILPPMSREEALETSKIYSVAGLLPAAGGLLRERPFRHPHHTSTVQSLAGSGMNGLPGEISLAHNGVLFLDELAEFGRSAVELLRQPLEDGVIQLCRARTRYCYPASFMLVAAMNPCPCGYLYDPRHACSCSSSAVMRYASKISGPLLDRIDIQLTVDAVAPEELVGGVGCGAPAGESSRAIAERVAKAREVQLRRYVGESFYTNARIPPALLMKYCKMGEAERVYLRKMVGQLNISARGYARILKISRTIADLDGEDFISLGHISSAVQFKLNIKRDI